MILDDEQLPSYILRASLLLLVLASFISYYFLSGPTGIGVFAGGSIAFLNFAWQRRTLRQILSNQAGHSTGAVFFRYLFRFGLNGLLLYLILTSGTVSVFGLLAGLSVVVVVIVALTLYAAFHKGD